MILIRSETLCPKLWWTLLSALIQSHIQSDYWNCVLEINVILI